jgi:hypothetical protein
MNKIQKIFVTIVSLVMTTASWADNTVKVNQPTYVVASAGGQTTSGGSPTIGVAGNTQVTITVTPPSNQYLSTLTATPFADAGNAGSRRALNPTINSTIPLTPGSGTNTYTFTMPNLDVEIDATFADCGDISGATITLTETSHVFDWLEHTPVISSVVVNETTLTKDVDYTVTGITGYTNAGTYDITLTGKGKYKNTKTVTYSIIKRSISDAKITLSNESYVYKKGTKQIATISGVYLNGQELTLGSSTNGYQEVKYYAVDYDPANPPATLPTPYTDETIESKNAGTYTIIIKGKGNFDEATYARATYTINRKEISTCDISPATGSFTYTGSEITFDPTIRDNKNQQQLEENTDYTIAGNVKTAVGGYNATVTGINNYTGSVNVPFTINVSNDGYYIVFEPANTTYDPPFSTTHSETYTGGQIELTPGTNIFVRKQVGTAPASSDPVLGTAYYRLVYNNNTDVGTATVTAIGKGGYDFMANANFEITAKDITDNDNIVITLGSETLTYNGSKQRPSVTVHDDQRDVDLRENIDYTLSDGAVDAGSHTVTVTGKGNYDGSKVSGNYTIGTLDMTTTNTIVTLEYNSTVYNRSEQKPDIERVTVNGIQLNEGDSTITYPTSDYTNQGAKTIRISGKGNFGGSKEVTYTIAQKPITSSMVTLSSSDPTTDPFVNNSFTYNSSPHVPVVTVKDGDVTLTPSTSTAVNEYKLTNEGGTAVGVYYAKVEGKGNYTGKVEVPYSIVSNNSDTGVSVTYAENDDDIIYTGNPITLTLTVTKDNNPLTEGNENDYEVVYNNNTNVGQATISVIGRNNYNFVKHIPFTIKKCPLTAAMVSLSASNFTYNGSAQKPNITVTYSGVRTEGLDYTLVNAGTTDVGPGYYEVTGIGNFTGTLKSTDTGMPTYTISTLDISSTSTQVSNVDIVLYPLANAVYDGTQKKPGVQKVVITKTDNSEIVLTSGYDVGYGTNIDAGSTASVTISGTNFTGTASTHFTILPKPLTDAMVELSYTSVTYTGGELKPTVTVTDVALSGTVASANYVVHYPVDVTAPGEKEVQIVGQKNYSGTIVKKYVINKIGDDNITVTIGGDYTYNGAAQTPHDVSGTNNITVTKGTTTTTTLVFGTDYDVTYVNNINAGIATAIITGIGNYSFTKEATFNIGKKELSTATIALTGIPVVSTDTYYTYDGTLKKPGVSVTDGTPSIISSKDYTITNEGNINASSTPYTVTISSNEDGNYTGEVIKTYKIRPYALPATTAVTLDQSTFIYDGDNKTPNVLVVKVGELVVPTYSTTYANNQNAALSTAATAPTVTVTASGNFSGSIDKTFTISPKPVTADMIVIPEAEMNMVYTGEVLTPTPNIRDLKDPNNLATNIITEDDYDITNPGGTEVGNYEVKIVGKRNYTGEATKQYSITAQGSTGFTIATVIEDQTYTGSPITPTVTVNKAGSTTTALNPGTDYDVAYSDNVNVGTATVTVTGRGNYAGIKTTTFDITAKTLTEAMVTLSTPTTFTYNGNIQKPTVTVSDGNAMTSLDYTINNADHSDANTYNITVTGTHNYTGSVTKQYTISPLNITGASVTLEALTYTYSGTAQKPAVSEVKVGTLTVPCTDYGITYPVDATSHGQKTITITAQNNFTGTVTKDYTISPKPVTSDMIILSNSNLEYTGSLLKPTVTVKDGENTLIVGDTKDYTLVNEGAVNVGTYSVSITGHGNYGGQASKEYNIIATGSAGFTIDDISDVTYNGTTQEPTVVVRDANNPDVVLTKDTHYTVNFTNNTNVGTASANVTGKGNYQGTATKTFKINPKTLTADMVQVTGYTLPTGDGFIYNGAIQKPAVMVADGSAMTADDYVVVNNGGLNVNETSSPYEITITGSNNYTGTVTKTFNIQPLSIEDAAITLYQLPDKAYDGTEKKPGVREVVTAANIVVPTVGYDVAYGNNINAGTATVTVTGKNNFTGTASTTFEIEKKAVNSSMITLSQENFNYTGELQKPTVTVSDKNGDTERITADDYTLTNDGGIEVGNYKVKIVGKRNYKGEAEKQYSIWEKDAVINHFTITLGEASVEYDGTEKKPTVTVKDGDKKLEAETDYTVVFSDNTNAGTATVTVTGKGNYTGTRNTTFEITKKPLTAAMITVSGYTTADGFIYNGKNQAPTVVVRDGTALKASDYVITNNGGVNQGTYHAIVTATGNYSGEFDYPYVIAKRSIEGAKVTLYELESYVYDGKAKKPGVKEVAFGEDVIPTAGYAVAYSNNTDAGTATVTVTGQGNYTGTLTTEFTIERQSLTADMIILSNEEYVYNGATQKPVVVLMNGGTEMVLDTDYTLTNEGGISVGVYDVIANGKGNYNGMATKQFSIISKGIGSFDVTLSTEQVVYTGSEHRPTVTVKDGDKTLTPGSEFSVSYTDNTNAGTATVTITGQGEYSGTATKTFIIKPKPLTEDMVFLSSTSYTYNTLQQKPTVTVSDQSFLTANDYTLTNDGGINHGDYDVVVIGRNNYTGVITKQFTIKPLSIETAKVVLYEMASYVYDGTAKNPGVREVAISSTIVPTSSYTVEISPNVNVGTVTVTVTGKENFTGTASTTFEITPKPITDNMVILSEEVFYYNGELQRPDVEVKDGENTLVEETDYTIVNEGGTEVGSYEVKVTGLGNYTSEVIKTYVIERSDFSVDITATDEEQKEFAVSLIVSLIDEENNNIRVKGVKIPESEKDKEIDLTIPANCTVDEVTYTITEIAAYAFEDAEHLQNLYLPDTEEALTIGDNAIPATTTIHTSLALLDDYALMPSLGANFRNDKVMTTVKAKNQYWTFSSGVDVYVPENITVFTVQERTTTTVAIVELTSTELNVSGASVIKSNNGVLLSGNSDTSYDIVACPRRMSSGTFISTDDHKDYGEENCLEPVIEATHYENDYYILKDNKFCSIKLEDEAVKVPAGKAVLHLSAVAQGRSYNTVLDVINEGTTSVSEEVNVNSKKFAPADWYDLNGRKIEGRPVKKGVYIVNGKKVVIK